jgi:sensor histidine kinase YesM
MLALKLDRVQDSIVVPQVTITRQDEIGRLTRSFYAMLERIQQLIVKTREMEERKKELELKVLQSQISPHFLYNTLACIGSLARQQRLGEVGETIRSLVGILELTFDKTRAEVTVADEIRALKQYIQIQTIRYIGKFEFRCDVDPGMEHSLILKLTLQPLVENAIFHGILPTKSYPGMITVRGRRYGNRLTFLICDNGAGMAKARQAELLQPGPHGRSKDRLTGIGVSNVQERLRLHFGMAYGLRIRSTLGKGTCIRVTLPVIPYHEHLGNRIERNGGNE